ncbi:hypothetical protein [Mycolicibacterium sp. P1-18]|uniref:hypothetical protein n=1 Tax=Mycolicibacterium sp. P1-18 TaxID=2024615 RepID=UPI001563E141|nr:hypothetical protein [Mycolicibacterium sp. P1-18]
MGNVWVSAAGLQTLAGVFGEQAAGVAATSTAPPVTGGFAFSAAAVRSVHAAVGDAAVTVADRLTATEALVSAARTGYEATDVANATAIGAVAGGLGVVGEG